MLDRFGVSVNAVIYEVTGPMCFDLDVDYIIHGASNASSNFYTKEQGETMPVNNIGMDNIMGYALVRNAKKFYIFLLVKYMG